MYLKHKTVSNFLWCKSTDNKTFERLLLRMQSCLECENLRFQNCLHSIDNTTLMWLHCVGEATTLLGGSHSAPFSWEGRSQAYAACCARSFLLSLAKAEKDKQCAVRAAFFSFCALAGVRRRKKPYVLLGLTCGLTGPPLDRNQLFFHSYLGNLGSSVRENEAVWHTFLKRRTAKLSEEEGARK